MLSGLFGNPAHSFLHANAIRYCMAFVGAGTGLDDDVVQIVCVGYVPPASLPFLGDPDDRPFTNWQDLVISLEFAYAFQEDINLFVEAVRIVERHRRSRWQLVDGDLATGHPQKLIREDLPVGFSLQRRMFVGVLFQLGQRAQINGREVWPALPVPARVTRDYSWLTMRQECRRFNGLRLCDQFARWPTSDILPSLRAHTPDLSTRTDVNERRTIPKRE